MIATTRTMFRAPLYLAFIVIGSLALAGDPPEPGRALIGIQSGLQRSPDVYVAAKLEVVGVPKCPAPTNNESCVGDAKIVETFASRGGAFHPGDIVLMLGSGSVGTDYLAFLVPVPDRPNVFGATFLTVDVSKEEREVFQEDLKRAGL